MYLHMGFIDNVNVLMLYALCHVYFICLRKCFQMGKINLGLEMTLADVRERMIEKFGHKFGPELTLYFLQPPKWTNKVPFFTPTCHWRLNIINITILSTSQYTQSYLAIRFLIDACIFFSRYQSNRSPTCT